MNIWSIGPERAAPTDAQYERLRSLATKDTGAVSLERRLTTFLLLLLAVAVVSFVVLALLPRWTMGPYALVGAFLLWLAFPRINRWAYALRARDAMLQRPDLAPCDACGSTADVDGGDYATCRACGGVTYVSGWPRSALGEPPALAPLSDGAYRAARAYASKIASTGQVLLLILIALIVLAVVGVTLIASGNAPTSYFGTASPVLVLFIVLNSGLQRRADACSLLLLTRPDLWNPATTNLGAHEIRGVDARYLRALDLARRLRERFEREGARLVPSP